MLTQNQVQFTVSTQAQYDSSAKDASTFYYVVENEATPNTGDTGKLYIGTHLIGSGVDISDVIEYLTVNSTVFPLLTSGDILPKHDTVTEVNTIDKVTTTGYKLDVKSGEGRLISIRGLLSKGGQNNSVASCGLNSFVPLPFTGVNYVSTGMNLMDQAFTLEGRTVTNGTIVSSATHNLWFFPVAKTVIGTYGSADENNGYVIVGEAEGYLNVSAVYDCSRNPMNYETLSPEISSCSYRTVGPSGNTRRYYSPVGPWMIIDTTDRVTTEILEDGCYFKVGPNYVGCHLAWSGYMDTVAGVSNSDFVRFEDIINLHTWGMAGIVSPGRQVYDQIDFLEDMNLYTSRIDRVRVDQLDWVQDASDRKVWSCYLWGVEPDGLWAMYQGPSLKEASLSGSTLTLTMATADLSPASSQFNSEYIYYELASPDTYRGESTVDTILYNDFGTTYLMDSSAEYPYNELCGTALVEEEFMQSGRDQLFNAVDRLNVMEEVVATALCQLDGRLGTIEDRITNGFEYLKIEEIDAGTINVTNINASHIQVDDIEVTGGINIPTWNDF